MNMLVQPWMWTTTFLLVILWTILYFYVTRKFKYWKEKGVEFLKPVPFFGNAVDIFTLKTSIGELCYDLYNSTTAPFLGFFICQEPYLLVRDLDLVKTILIKDFADFSNRSITNNIRDDPVGSHMLFLSKTPIWRELRRKISPVFTTGKLKLMHELIRGGAEEMIEYLHKEIRIDPIVETREVAAKFSTEGITSTAFGVKAGCFNREDAPFRTISRRIFNWHIFERAISTSCYFIAPSLVKLFRLKFVDSTSSKFLRDAFWNMMKERQISKNTRNDLIDILIEMRKEDPEEENRLDGDMLVAQAAQFFIAGYETTSSTISFALYELAKEPEIQRRVREEVVEVKNKHGKFTYEALKEAKYLEMVVKETLRFYPVLPFLDRRCNVDYTIPGTDVTLKKGTGIFISCLGPHYDPHLFPNPTKFDPERFSEENSNIQPFSYIPFGEGPRNCIGARYGSLTSITALAHILSEFEVELCDQTQKVMKFDPKGFLLAPIGGLRLKFKKIQGYES